MKKPPTIVPLALFLLCGLVLPGCDSSSSSRSSDPAEPAFSQSLFEGDSATVDNPYFPLIPRSVCVSQRDGEDGSEINVLEVLDETRAVDGVECAVVRERTFIDELVMEDTEDWYAQDRSGNVWYMGEEVVNYEYDDEGNLIGTDDSGSWEAGIDVMGIGAIAQPGITMKATLVPGDSYRQEFYPGIAEDTARIVATNVPVTLADGSIYSCLQVQDMDSAEDEGDEFEYFAPGVGLVRSELAADGSERTELRGVFHLGDESLPDFAAATFSNPTSITHPFLPFTPESVGTYFQPTDDGVETIIVEVLTTTRLVAGVECAVVTDLVFLDGLLIEDTDDWYAQDDDGNVWYMGEEVVNFEYDDDGNLIGTDTDGSWEAGVDGALAGILMWQTPVIGESYYQEFYEDEAVDMAVVVAEGVSVELADGTTFDGCRQILEWSSLDPGALEYKFYAAGQGVVLEEPLHDSARVELAGTFVVTDESLPDFGAATFSSPTTITNGYLPYAPGQVLEYEKETEDGLEEILVEVLATTRIVAGVECTVVRDRVFLDGLLLEDTQDWFAQDDAGNVWYMGEEVINYEYDDDGNLIGTNNDGSWEAGIDGAVAGINMWQSPTVGQSYYQEFYEDEAEDMAVVVAASGVTVELENGTVFEDCRQILEWTSLEPDALGYKFYAPGIGVVLEQDAGSDERTELVTP